MFFRFFCRCYFLVARALHRLCFVRTASHSVNRIELYANHNDKFCIIVRDSEVGGSGVTEVSHKLHLYLWAISLSLLLLLLFMSSRTIFFSFVNSLIQLISFHYC